MSMTVYTVRCGKYVAAAGFVLVSPIVFWFVGPLAIGISSDIVHEIGAAASTLGVCGAVALFALYRLHQS
jgi:hypothetical protein